MNIDEIHFTKYQIFVGLISMDEYMLFSCYILVYLYGAEISGTY